MNSLDQTGSIAIIGGGISGLAAAQRIQETRPELKVTLFEASQRLGGVIQSTSADGFLFEHSADNFIVSEELPWAGELCKKLGVELVPTSNQHRGAMILRGTQLHAVPDGLHLMTVEKLWPMLSTPLLSWRGKLRAVAERFVPPRKSGSTGAAEESLTEFATRRFGREAFEQIIQPLVSGIYTADPTKLSMSAALPQFVKMEERYGSMIQAGFAKRSKTSDRGARYSLFRAPRGGMQKLIDALQDSLHGVTVRLDSAIDRISLSDNAWDLQLGDAVEQFDAVILSTPATRAARLLEFDAALCEPLQQIPHVSTAVVCLGYRREQVSHPLNAFGCVVPSIENRKLLAVSFTSQKFPTHAPSGHVLLRVFVGGALQPEIANLADEELMSVVASELADLFGAKGQPVTSKIVRWPDTTPQYHLGHIERVSQIEQRIAEQPRLELTGNAYHGVGIPQCIRGGWQAADRILSAIP